MNWEFINSFAPWVAGIGSIAAVIVSLYLASKYQSVRIKVYSNISTLFASNDQSGDQKIVLINITNIGFRPATINSITIKYGVFKKNTFLTRNVNYDHNVNFPFEIKSGASRDLIIKLTTFEGIIVYTDADLKGLKGLVNIYSMKFIVNTTIDKKYKSRFGKSIRTFIRKEC